MSAIKDIYDLVEKLHTSIKDKQTLELLLPIKEKIIEAEKKNLQLQTKNFELTKFYENKITQMDKQILDLESEIKKLKHKDMVQIGVIKDRPNR
jgi:hypothetical protein